MKKLKTLQEFVDSSEKKKEVVTEAADWDDTSKKKKDSNTVSCDKDETYERDYIKGVIKKDRPNQYVTSKIDDAISHCCNKEGQSRNRAEFMKCVYSELGNGLNGGSVAKKTD